MTWLEAYECVQLDGARLDPHGGGRRVQETTREGLNMVYFARIREDRPIKIGFSDDVDRRLIQLERHCRQPLALLHVMDGVPDGERGIHERFAHLRLGMTEQFRPGADLMEFVGKPLHVRPDPDAVEVLKPRSPEPDDITVKLDWAVATQARYVAENRKITLAEYPLSIVRPIVAAHFQAEVRGMELTASHRVPRTDKEVPSK